jgi:RsiW-degrading membrane proteinase PrsW (M82 family)
MLWDTMIEFLKSWFIFPGLKWDLMLVSIGLAVAFGIIWMLGYWPWIIKKVWFWPVLIASAFLTLLAITFAQIPLQYYIDKGLGLAWDTTTIAKWYLLAGIPTVLASGVVQEASKSVPMAVWWWRSGRTLTPKTGLLIGAAAGVGFGIFEAFWVHGQVFASGWTTQLITQYGFDGISGFWERFFTVGFHTAVSALVGYGLAKGKWWQYYLIAAGLHTVANYSAVFVGYFAYIRPAAWFKITYIEIYIAVLTAIIAAVVLYLRWRKSEEETPGDTVETTAPPPPELPADIVD